ncbi:MAG: hypothetical protein ACLGIO_11440 [Acidimicrobiia bacterium]
MYESEITTGLEVFRVSDRATAGAVRLPYLNPRPRTSPSTGGRPGPSDERAGPPRGPLS